MKMYIRASLVFVSAIAGLTLGAAVVRQLSGPMFDARVVDHFSQYEADRGSINVVFIGSSRIGVNIDPIAFDTRTDELGYHTKSYNFCLGAITAEEARRIIEEIVRDKARPGLLVVELLPAHGGVRDYDLITDRNLWWRRVRDIPVVYGDVIRAANWPELRVHALLFFVRGFRMGKGPEIFARLTSEEVQPRPVKNSGFTPFKNRWGSFDRQLMINNVADNLRNGTSEPEEIEPYLRFQRQIVDIVAGQTEVLFLLPPGSPLLPSSLRDHPEILATNDPSRFPSLYEPEKWADINHLMGDGAREHGQIIAEELVSRGDGQLLRFAKK